MIIDWYDITISSLVILWEGVVEFIPKLIGAIIIFVVGWIIAMIVGKVVAEILRRIKFNNLFTKGSMKNALEKADIKVDASGFIGAIFKWVLVIVFLLAAVEVLGLGYFATFLVTVLAYLPNVIVAALIFVVAVIIADITEKVVRAGIEGTQIGYGYAAGVIVRWAIWIFALLIILNQLGVAPAIVQILISGLVALIVIAGGLAFGLGGKHQAADNLDKLRKKLQG